ncbi:pirin family protein [Acidaminobacter sp. JC074]|uniref:pirin family protein n=1 Tax=Acidaminobacter sp. JC074 TaxID=2530199 RepID=UPI001F11290E|nr:pirin family protein [Acidaminobacter sp. JC074]MCH4887172.1 pirin family protein [Acidaminobacter sp. JC074]
MKYIDHRDIGYFNHGWLKTYHHFSFADYHNPERMRYGPLRVLNDDIIDPHQGFPKHPHRDMEIISYVIDGGLSHGDSMGHEETVYRGQVQYMSAGKGVYHSEYNHGDEPVRLLQIWIYPDEKSYEPTYGDYRFDWKARINKWLHLVGDKAPIKIHQDANIYVTYLEKDHELNFEVKENRKIYVVQIEGQSKVGQKEFKTRDAIETDETLDFKAETDSHILVIEMRS